MSRALEEVLDRACDALIAGDLTALAGVADRVEALSLELPKLDRTVAERLRRKAVRNADLLLAAQRGIAAARQRIAEIHAGPSLSTYDIHGRREVIAGLSSGQPRRV